MNKYQQTADFVAAYYGRGHVPVVNEVDGMAAWAYTRPVVVCTWEWLLVRKHVRDIVEVLRQCTERKRLW